MSEFGYFDDPYEIDARQKLMLAALILAAPRNEESFSRWLAEADLDAIDRNALRLVPALFRKFGGSIGASG